MTGKRSPLVTVTVASLVDCFRDGLIALIPIAERSGIVWRGECEWVLNARIGDELRALTEFSC